MDTVIVHFGEGEKKDFVILKAEPGRLPVKEEVYECHKDLLTDREVAMSISDFINNSISRGMKVHISKNKSHIMTFDTDVIKAIQIVYFKVCPEPLISFLHLLKNYLEKE